MPLLLWRLLIQPLSVEERNQKRSDTSCLPHIADYNELGWPLSRAYRPSSVGLLTSDPETDRHRQQQRLSYLHKKELLPRPIWVENFFVKTDADSSFLLFLSAQHVYTVRIESWPKLEAFAWKNMLNLSASDDLLQYCGFFSWVDGSLRWKAYHWRWLPLCFEYGSYEFLVSVVWAEHLAFFTIL